MAISVDGPTHRQFLTSLEKPITDRGVVELWRIQDGSRAP
jgi:hypothetical protein